MAIFNSYVKLPEGTNNTLRFPVDVPSKSSFFETMRGWSLVQKPWLYRCERCNYELFCIVNRCKSGDKFQLLAWSSQFPKRGHTEPKTLATELRLATATWKLTKDLSPFGALGRPWTVFADLEHKAFQRICIKHQQQLLNLRLKHWLTANVQVDASIPPDKEKREAQVQLFSFGTQNRQIVNSHPHPLPPHLPHLLPWLPWRNNGVLWLWSYSKLIFTCRSDKVRGVVIPTNPTDQGTGREHRFWPLPLVSRSKSSMLDGFMALTKSISVLIVYLSFWGYPLILDYQYRNTFLFHSTVCLIRRTWQPAFDPAPEMNDFRLQQDRRWEMGLCHWLQWHGTE